MAKEDYFCSAGILAYAQHENPNAGLKEAGKILADLICQNYPERVYGNCASDMQTITYFNDHPATTYEDVERMFEKAEVLYDEYMLAQALDS